MALAGRSTRRAGGGRLILIGVVITLIVLLVDASLKSSSNKSSDRLSAQAWVDQVLPLVRDSTAEGQELNTVRTKWQTLSATAMASQLHATASFAAASYKTARKLVPPSDYLSAQGLLDACLMLREQGSAAVAKAVIAGLSGPSPPAPADATSLVAAGEKLQAADQVYRSFIRSLGGLHVKMPSSTWVNDGSLYQPQTSSAYLTALRNTTNLQPVHRVVLDSFTTSPQPETTTNGVEVMPYSPTLSVEVVLANTGNQTEKAVTLTATLSAAVKQPTLRKFLGPMKPGDPESVTIGPLFPVRGKPITLTLTVAGSSALPASTRTLAFEMPAASSPPTTAAPPPTPAVPPTTVPAAGGSPVAPPP